MQLTYQVAVRSLFAAAVLATPLAQAAGGARDIASVGAAERQSLPDTALVTVQGKQVTMSALRAFHAARKQQMAQATELGRSVARAMEHERAGSPGVATPAPPSPPAPSMGPQGAATAPSVVGAGMPSAKPIVRQSPSSFNPKIAMGKPIPMEEKDLTMFAKDYQDFCKAAKATACIYLPKIAPWQLEISAKGGMNPSSPLRVILDPLITDAAVCKAEGGSLKHLFGCIYYYPVHQNTNFLPSLAPKLQSAVHCPVPAAAGPGFEKMWTTVISPKGAAMAKWESKNAMWPAWLQKDAANANAKPASCVVQVFAAL